MLLRPWTYSQRYCSPKTFKTHNYSLVHKCNVNVNFLFKVNYSLIGFHNITPWCCGFDLICNTATWDILNSEVSLEMSLFGVHELDFRVRVYFDYWHPIKDIRDTWDLTLFLPFPILVIKYLLILIWKSSLKCKQLKIKRK